MHFSDGSCSGKADAAAAAGLGTCTIAAIEAVEQVFWRTIGQLCGRWDFMKLLKWKSCLREFHGGNVKTQTALGDALVVWLSDRGSTPLGSTTLEKSELNSGRKWVRISLFL